MSAAHPVARPARTRRSTGLRFFRPAEVEILRGDASKAQRVLGWQPQVSFEEMVRLMVERDLELVARDG